MHVHEHACTNKQAHTHTNAKFSYIICLSLLSPNTVDLTCDNQFNTSQQRRDISTKENIK